MITYLGDYLEDSAVFFMYNTTDQGGSSVSPSADGTIRVYKANATEATWATQRSSQAGINLYDDFDSSADLDAGVQAVYIDTSDNTDAGFYATGNDYFIVLDSATVDGETISAALAMFSIENRTVNADRIGGSNTAATNLSAGAEAVVTATLTGTPTTTSLASTDDLQNNYEDDVFIDRYVYIRDGTYAGEFAKITDFVKSTGTLTVEALSGAPSLGDNIVIV